MVYLQNGGTHLLTPEKKTQHLFLIKSHTGEHPLYSQEKILVADPLENMPSGLYINGEFG